jgi:hypothetical protein
MEEMLLCWWFGGWTSGGYIEKGRREGGSGWREGDAAQHCVCRTTVGM